MGNVLNPGRRVWYRVLRARRERARERESERNMQQKAFAIALLLACAIVCNRAALAAESGSLDDEAPGAEQDGGPGYGFDCVIPPTPTLGKGNPNAAVCTKYKD